MKLAVTFLVVTLVLMAKPSHQHVTENELTVYSQFWSENKISFYESILYHLEMIARYGKLSGRDFESIKFIWNELNSMSKKLNSKKDPRPVYWYSRMG